MVTGLQIIEVLRLACQAIIAICGVLMSVEGQAMMKASRDNAQEWKNTMKELGDWFTSLVPSEEPKPKIP